MYLTQKVFNDINNISMFVYEQVTPTCKNTYQVVYDFMTNGEFIGFDFKGARGNPKLGIARVSIHPNIRAKTYLLFRHREKIYKVLYSNEDGYMEKFYIRLVKAVTGKSYVYNTMSITGMLCRHYRKMLADPVEGSNLISGERIAELLRENSNVERVHEVIEKYASQHQKVSSALKNNLVNHFQSIDSRSLVESFHTVATCAADCQAMSMNQDIVLKLMRTAMRHHGEIKHFNDAVKDEIVNARLVRRVQT